MRKRILQASLSWIALIGLASPTVSRATKPIVRQMGHTLGSRSLSVSRDTSAGPPGSAS